MGLQDPPLDELGRECVFTVLGALEPFQRPFQWNRGGESEPSGPAGVLSSSRLGINMCGDENH